MSETQRRVVWIPKKPTVTTAPQQAVSPAQLRREEYKGFGTQYVAPVLAVGLSFIEQERAAEEAAIRKQLQDQVTAAEAEARRKFESDLAARKAQAKAEFEAGLTAEKSKDTFNQQLAKEEARQRSVFKADLAAGRQAFLGGSLGKAKREYQMRYGQALNPKAYRAAESSAAEIFSGLAQPEGQQFEQSLTAWKETETKKRQKEAAEWEAQQRSAFEEELKPWESESRASLEAQISTWKAGEAARFEGQIGEWGKTWQTKGLAERMMEWTVVPLAERFGLRPLPTYPLSRKDVAYIMGKPTKPTETHPLAGLAGIVASAESLVYGVGQLAELKTPRMPPTLTGGLISSGIESVMKWQLTPSSELLQVSKMEPSYAIGSVMGDILIAYGIGKAVKAGTKAVKGAAEFIYEGSGLKYSHALYEAKELSLKISGYLPKSPLAALKESHLAYELSEASTWLKGKMPWIKMQKGLAPSIVGLPTLEEETSVEGISTLQGMIKPSKALETAKALGLTPLQYEEALYPKIFAGMQLLGWTEAPKTAALGLTKAAVETAKQIAKSGTSLSEALAETMWIGATAGEKWAVRAGVIPSLEDVIVQPPKEAVEQMIKGGRYFDIDLTRALGFSKFPYKEAAAGRYFFEKEKLPSLKDLLKSVKAETTLSKLLLEPAQRILPSLSFIPEGVKALPSSAPQILGVSGVLMPHLLPRKVQKPKKETKAKPILLQALSPLARTVLGQKQKQVPEQIQVQKLKLPVVPRIVIRPPSSVLFTPRKRKEEGLAKQKKRRLQKPYTRRIAYFVYPVAEPSEVSRYILGNLLSPKRHHRSK